MRYIDFMTTEIKDFAISAPDGQLIRGVCRDTGSGPIGVFLHGLLSEADGTKSMHLWNEAVRMNRSWIRFDMRGHGKSDGRFEEFKISRALEDSKLVLSKFSNRPKILVGSSMGGWTAAQVALDAEMKIAGIVILAPAFGFIHQIYDSLNPEEQQSWKESRIKRFESPEMEEDFSLSYDAVIDSRLNNPFTASVQYRHPVHIIHGSLDDVVPVKQSIAFKKHVSSKVELNVIQDGDHRLTDHIDVITKAVDDLWPAD